MAESSKVNPNNANGRNEYAGNVAPKRADQTTTGGTAGSYYPGDPVGNVVDRSRINRTKDQVSTQGTAVFPGGVSSGSGF